MTGTALVAGVGNVFLGDDGFGVEVAARLAHQPLRDGVRVLDAGIRARDLAYELVDGRYDTAILVDVVSRGGAPGTLYVIEPDVDDTTGATAMDGHTMTPDATLAFVRALGGTPTKILIVGCEPASLDEAMGLSPAVSAAVEGAVALVRDLLCA